MRKKTFDRDEIWDNVKANANLHGFFLENDRFVFSMFMIAFDAWRDLFFVAKILFRMIGFYDPNRLDGGEISAKQFFRYLDFPLEFAIILIF